MVLHYGKTNILQPLLEQAEVEAKTQGKPSRKLLLQIAQKLIRWAPNYYSNAGDDSYTPEEKTAAKQLLIANNMENYTSLSTRRKHMLLRQIQQELDELPPEAPT